MKETLVIVAEGCPHCKALVEKLPKDQVKVLDVTKDLRAAAIVRDLGIYKVPLIVTVEKIGDKEIEYCALGKEDKEVKVKCVKASPEASVEVTEKKES